MPVQEQQVQLSPAKVAILMLTTAHELYKKSSQPASRLMYHIGALMAREHLASEDANSAQKLLESVAGEHSDAASMQLMNTYQGSKSETKKLLEPDGMSRLWNMHACPDATLSSHQLKSMTRLPTWPQLVVCAGQRAQKTPRV